MFRNLLKSFVRSPPVLRAGHPVLRIPCKNIDASSPEAQKIVAEMTRVFQSQLTPVIGLAAPQIGHPFRIIGIQVTEKKTLEEYSMQEFPLTFMINPKIEKGGKQVSDYEFCESIPNYSALIKRYERVKVSFEDTNGKQHSKDFKGLLARIVQHEVDHLDGILFMDNMEKQTLRHDSYIGQYEIYKG